MSALDLPLIRTLILEFLARRDLSFELGTKAGQAGRLLICCEGYCYERSSLSRVSLSRVAPVLSCISPRGVEA